MMVTIIAREGGAGHYPENFPIVKGAVRAPSTNERVCAPLLTIVLQASITVPKIMMMRGIMNWDAIGAIGEILGAIAVVLTLGYLAMQVRQTNKIAQAESYGKIIDAHVGHHRVLSSRPGMIDIWGRGLTDLGQLNADEYGMFHSFIGPIVLEFQKYLYLYRSGLVPQATFDMFENDIVASLLSPGGRTWPAARSSSARSPAGRPRSSWYAAPAPPPPGRAHSTAPAAASRQCTTGRRSEKSRT